MKKLIILMAAAMLISSTVLCGCSYMDLSMDNINGAIHEQLDSMKDTTPTENAQGIKVANNEYLMREADSENPYINNNLYGGEFVLKDYKVYKNISNIGLKEFEYNSDMYSGEALDENYNLLDGYYVVELDYDVTPTNDNETFSIITNNLISVPKEKKDTYTHTMPDDSSEEPEIIRFGKKEPIFVSITNADGTLKEPKYEESGADDFYMAYNIDGGTVSVRYGILVPAAAWEKAMSDTTKDISVWFGTEEVIVDETVIQYEVYQRLDIRKLVAVKEQAVRE